MVQDLRFSRRNNPEDTILHSHRRENLKSCTMLSVRGLAEFRVIDTIFTKVRKGGNLPKWFFFGGGAKFTFS
jgi:hypothetical protein